MFWWYVFCCFFFRCWFGFFYMHEFNPAGAHAFVEYWYNIIFSESCLEYHTKVLFMKKSIKRRKSAICSYIIWNKNNRIFHSCHHGATIDSFVVCTRPLFLKTTQISKLLTKNQSPIRRVVVRSSRLPISQNMRILGQSPWSLVWQSVLLGNGWNSGAEPGM